MVKVRHQETRVSTEFGDRLQQLRLHKNMSLHVLADKVGVGVSAITAYENRGYFPKFHQLVCLAQALDVDLNWLVGLSEINNPIEPKVEGVYLRGELRDTPLNVLSTIQTDKGLKIWVKE